MNETFNIKRGGQMAMNTITHSFPTKTLAMSTAATQRLNYRISMLDPYARNAFFQSKFRLSEILCRHGYCTWREIQHRETGESLCKLYFRLGNQCFNWAIPNSRINFEVAVKDPPTVYSGDPANETKIALMSDSELLLAASGIEAETVADKPVIANAESESDDQQLVWLKSFHDKYGKWPMRDDLYPSNNPLGMKAYLWREYYKRGTLDWVVVKRLNALKFPWDGRSVNWFENYIKLYEFLSQKAFWPTRAKGTEKGEAELGEWVSLQRQMYHRGELSGRKKWLLDSLNFDWVRYSDHQEKYQTVR